MSLRDDLMAHVSRTKLRANRRNARRSTGPRTPEGKARSSMNAVRHGVFCQAAVLDGEDAEAFAAIRRGYVEHYGPLTFPECQVVEEMATAAWKLTRLREAERWFHTNLADESREHAGGRWSYEAEEERQLRSVDPAGRGRMPWDTEMWPPPGYTLSLALADEGGALDVERVSRLEQRLMNTVFRCERTLRSMRQDLLERLATRAAPGGLPPSPFLDVPQADDADEEEDDPRDGADRDDAAPGDPVPPATEDGDGVACAQMQNEPTADKSPATPGPVNGCDHAPRTAERPLSGTGVPPVRSEPPNDAEIAETAEEGRSWT